MNWNDQQLAIFDHLQHYDDHLQVIARAGCGKTTTLVEASNRLNGYNILLCAFNKRIQEELASRVTNSKVKTLHSLGLAACKRGGLLNAKVDSKKTINHVKAAMDELFMTQGKYEDRKQIKALVSLAKNTLAEGEATLERLALDRGLATKEFPATDIAKAAQRVLETTLEDTTTIDFDDMLWFPVKLGLSVPQFQIVLVDEAQDLNPVQMELIRKTGPEQVVTVGDPAQSIYAFRGADERAMERLAAEFDGERVELPMTYRCGKDIVALAQKFVPSILCPDDQHQGIVNQVKPEDVIGATPGDFVLSRLNAPLTAVCMKLLAKGVPAQIVGKDIGLVLAGILEKSKQRSVASFLKWLDEYEAVQTAYYKEQDCEEQLEAISDQCEALRVLCQGHEQVYHVGLQIKQMFSDEAEGVICSTVHKAKGLEANRVWLLADTFKCQRSQQERNIAYVAITRARQELNLCGSLKTLNSTPEK